MLALPVHTVQKTVLAVFRHSKRQAETKKNG